MFAGSVIPRARLGSFGLLRARRRSEAAPCPWSAPSNRNPTLRGDGKRVGKAELTSPAGAAAGTPPSRRRTRALCPPALLGDGKAFPELCWAPSFCSHPITVPVWPTTAGPPHPSDGPSEAGGPEQLCLQHPHLWGAFMAA